MRPRSRSLSLLLAAALVAALLPATAAVAAPPSVWIQNAADRAFQSTTMPAGARSSIRLAAARNEYEAAQILVRSPSAQTGVTVTANSLTGPAGATIPASNITVSKEYTHVNVELIDGEMHLPPDGSRNFTDALIENTPQNVPANVTQPYWYSVYVPAGQTPGTYTGTAVVGSSLGTVTVPVTVIVYNVTIPPTNQSTFKQNDWSWTTGSLEDGTKQAITLQYNVQTWDANWWTVIRNIAKNFRKHRQNVVFVDNTAMLEPDLQIDSAGNITFDWTKYDQFVQTFIDEGALQYLYSSCLIYKRRNAQGVLTPNIQLFKKVNGVITKYFEPTGTAAGAAYLHKFFRELKAHLDSKVLPDGRKWSEAFYLCASDEPDDATIENASYWVYDIYDDYFTTPAVRKTNEAHAHAHPNSLPYLTTVTPFTGHYDNDTKFYQNSLINGRDLWLYTMIWPQGNYMNRFISQHLSKTRLLPWLNWKIGASGYLHWGWNYWIYYINNQFVAVDTFTSPNNGDNWLVRPNKARYDIYDSVRSEAQRDGLEDRELLTILKKTKPLVAESIANSLISSFTSYTRTGGDVVDSHQQILDELASAQPDSRFPFADDFSSGGDVPWAHTIGNWSVAGGEYRQTDNQVWKAVAGIKGRSYRDFSLTFDAKIVSDGGSNLNWAGAVVRSKNATDMDSGYLVALRNNGTMFLYRAGVTPATGTVPGYVAGQYTRIKVVAQGSSLKVYAGNNPTPVMTLSDNSYQSGSIGLITGGAGAHFDNVVVDTEQNYADGKPVTASSSYTGSGWSTAAGVDGQRTSVPGAMGWTSEVTPQTSPQSFVVDFGKSQPVSRVDLHPRSDGVNAGHGFPEDFTIQTSPDNTTWTTQAARTGHPNPGGAVQSFSFPSVNARFLKVVGTKHTPEGPGASTHRMMFAEVQAFGGDLAAGKPVTASSTYEGSGWSTRNVTDGSRMSTNVSRGWSSDSNLGAQHSEWVAVDLGGKGTVDSVELTPRTDGDRVGAFFPTDFVIETSPDNVTWTTRRTVTAHPQPSSPAPQTFSFPAAQEVRFVRVRSVNGLRPSGSEYRMQFAELGVFGP